MRRKSNGCHSKFVCFAYRYFNRFFSVAIMSMRVIIGPHKETFDPCFCCEVTQKKLFNRQLPVFASNFFPHPQKEVYW